MMRTAAFPTSFVVQSSPVKFCGHWDDCGRRHRSGSHRGNVLPSSVGLTVHSDPPNGTFTALPRNTNSINGSKSPKRRCAERRLHNMAEGCGALWRAVGLWRVGGCVWRVVEVCLGVLKGCCVGCGGLLGGGCELVTRLPLRSENWWNPVPCVLRWPRALRRSQPPRWAKRMRKAMTVTAEKMNERGCAQGAVLLAGDTWGALGTWMGGSSDHRYWHRRGRRPGRGGERCLSGPVGGRAGGTLNQPVPLPLARCLRDR